MRNGEICSERLCTETLKSTADRIVLTTTAGISTDPSLSTRMSTKQLSRFCRSLLVVGLTSAGLAVATAADTTCLGKIYSTAEIAKESFTNDCGQPFNATQAYRCDWVPGGWQCKGPGDAKSTSTPPVSQLPAPEVTNIVVNTPGVAEIKFKRSSGATGYNVYRNGVYVATTTNTRYTDRSPTGIHTYYAVAFGPSNNFSPKSNLVKVNTRNKAYITTLSPVHIVLRSSSPAENSIHFSDRYNDDVKNYNIFRNGEYWTTLPATATFYRDSKPERTVIYEIQAVRNNGNGDEFGPKRVAIAPNSAYRAKQVAVTGKNAVTNASAGKANRATAEAQEARQESDESFDLFTDTLIPEVKLTGSVGTGGADIGLSADWNINNVIEKGLEWFDADERADVLEETAREAHENHEKCMAGSSSCSFGVINREESGPELNSPANNFGWGFRPCGEFC